MKVVAAFLSAWEVRLCGTNQKKTRNWPAGCACWAIALGLLASCATAPRPSPLSRQLSGVEMKDLQLGYKLYDFVTYFFAVVEGNADAIAAATDDAAIKVKALEWKSRAIPVCHMATLND